MKKEYIPATHRRKKLKEWVDANGTPSDNRSFFSQLLSGKASFGEKAARKLEDKYNMGDLYLDSEGGLNQDTVTLRQFDYEAACGNGVINQDYPELIRTLEIPKDQISELFGRRSLEGIDIITINGDSMAPTIPTKSLALVDIRVREFINDGVYVFVLREHVYMKRLQRMPDFIRAKSDNPHYDNIDIYPDQEQSDFQVVAKFVGVFPLNMIAL